LGRFGFGLSPHGGVMGPHLEAEKAVGSAHLGFGDNLVIGGKIHPGVRVECILSEVRVEVDSRAVIEKGRLVELVSGGTARCRSGSPSRSARAARRSRACTRTSCTCCPCPGTSR